MTPYYDESGVTIYHGDCREVIEQWEGLRTQSFDLLLTDPPYGLARFKKGFGTTRFKGHGAEKVGLEWDDPPTAGEFARLFAVCRAAIVWGANNFSLPESERFLVWDKQQTVSNFSDAELAFTNLPITAKVFHYGIHQHNAAYDSRQHPTQKPEPLMCWCLGLAPEAKTVLDPYMGSGTTLVACKRLGRLAVGIEREERYCAMAVERLRQGALPMEVESEPGESCI